MSGNNNIREAFNLASMLVDPKPIAPRGTAGAVATVLSEASTTAPARRLLERRSSTKFIDNLYDELRACGLDNGESLSILFDVLNRPTLSVRKAEGDKGSINVLQAVALDAPGSAVVRGIASVSVTILRSKPPEVAEAHCEVLPVDWQSSNADKVALVVLVEGWQQQYDVRPIDRRPSNAPKNWAWLGDPRAKAYRMVPVDWEQRLRRVGTILGMATLVAKTPSEAAAQSLHDAAAFGLLMKGTGNWDKVRQNFNRAEHDILDIGDVGTEFAKLLDSTRCILLDYVMECSIPRVPAARVLVAGDIIYHRKISPQPRTFDRFDTGSMQPCLHGAEYVTWSGDKAIKGMERRYSNFQRKMLFHCPKHPGCGMYMVRG